MRTLLNPSDKEAAAATRAHGPPCAKRLDELDACAVVLVPPGPMISPRRGLAPASQLPEEEVGVAARVGDVVEDGGAAGFARVVYDEVAEAQGPLGDGRGD